MLSLHPNQFKKSLFSILEVSSVYLPTLVNISFKYPCTIMLWFKYTTDECICLMTYW